MNRWDELNQMMNEVKAMPEMMEMPVVTKRVKKRVWRHRALVSVRNLAIACVVLVGGLSIGVNTSKSFADSIKNIPLIGRLVEAVDFSESYQEAINKEYLTKIGKVAHTKVGDVVLSYAMADDKNMVLFFDGDWKKKGYGLFIDSLTDADTGKEIEHGTASADVPYLSEKEIENTTIQAGVSWREYHKNVAISFSIRDKEAQKEVAENVKMTFSNRDKLPAKEYVINKKFEINGLRYQINKVTMYPLSTEVEVKYLDEDDLEFSRTVDMEFTLSDGKKTVGKHYLTGCSYFPDGDDKSTHKEYLDGGYYWSKKKLKLGLKYVMQLPESMREVTLDLNNNTLYDEHGPLKDFKVKHNGKKVVITTNKPLWDEIYNSDPFGYVRDAKTGETSWISAESTSGEIQKPREYQYIYEIKELSMDENGLVHFVRNYPEYIVHPKWSMEIDTQK
jgi:hypothetical protein